MTSDLHEWSFWLLVGVFALLLVAMFLYMVHLSRRAWLADQWIEAAGSMEAAVAELMRYKDETDIMMRQGMRDLGPMEIDRLMGED